MKKDAKLAATSSQAAKNIYDELAAHSLCTLGTVNDDGLPHLTAVYYSVDKNFVISFVTKTETKKYLNIQNDNRVRLLIFDEKKQLTIQVSGEAHEVVDKKITEDIIQNAYWLSHKNDNNAPPISKLFAGEYVGFQIMPKKISMGFFIRPQAGGYDMFESITFLN